MTASPLLEPQRVAEARWFYEHTTIPVPAIAERLGVGASTLFRHARRLGWRPRRRQHQWPDVAAAAPPIETIAQMAPTSPTAPGAPAPADEPGGDAISSPEQTTQSGAGEDRSLGLRLQRAVERELAAVEAIISRLGRYSQHPGEAERAARTLASLARTLNEVMRLNAPQPPPAADDEPVPRDFDELRRALSQKLERLVAEQSGALPEDT
jgi:hypothetical protein